MSEFLAVCSETECRVSTHVGHSDTIQRQALSASADPSRPPPAPMETRPKMAHPAADQR